MDGLPVLDTLWYCTWWCWISAWLLVLQLHISCQHVSLNKSDPFNNEFTVPLSIHMTMTQNSWAPKMDLEVLPNMIHFEVPLVLYFDPQLHSYTHICVYTILYYLISYYIRLYYIYIYTSTCQYFIYTYNFFLGNKTLSTIPAQPQHSSTWNHFPSVLLATLFSNVCTPLGPGNQSLAGEFSQGNVHEIARVGSSIKTSMWMVKYTLTGDLKWPFYPLVGGHLTFERVHLTIPKRSLWITRLQYVHYTLKGI